MSQTNAIFQAIADPTRRQLLLKLRNKRLSISQLAEDVPMSRNAVVKHLQQLENATLVTTEKKGRENLYSLNAEGLKEVQDWLAIFDEFWDEKLDALQKLF
ncbi:ArsR/SmtB family transcription factor [Kurthia zopfii]|uniref:ArsR/SmtB family transcription factor n=1 Tax=Kurthia zopfii TaxID=1650 RepID=UPI000F6EE845|nr:metalloregulator ArsR/SmtB family transcription factor [Kurthia zopfii]VEI07304.1 Uncharacterized protein conserved in archaea [Kurthia zopfii]